VFCDEPPFLTSNPAWSEEELANAGAIFSPEAVTGTANALAGPGGVATSKGFVGGMVTSAMPRETLEWMIECNLKFPRAHSAVLIYKHWHQDWRDPMPRIDVPTLERRRCIAQAVQSRWGPPWYEVGDGCHVIHRSDGRHMRMPAERGGSAPIVGAWRGGTRPTDEGVRMILVTGAAGMTGLAVIEALCQRGARVRALSGSGRSADKLLAAGACEFVTASFSDTVGLARAMASIDTVFHVPPRMKPEEVSNGLNVLAAARAAGVRRIALHSVINSQIQSIRFHVHKRLVEEAAMQSGLPWVIFQPTNYMQNVAWNWPRLTQQGEFLFPYSEHARISWLDLNDYAQAVARALTEPGWDYGVYEAVSTREPLTRVELASIWSRVLGREVRATTMALDEYMALPHWKGRDPREMEILRSMFTEFDCHGAPGGNSRMLGLLLGREPTSYEAFAQRFAATRTSMTG
jgi:uncharacterized protein YbjT (DUF2867 family)